MSEIMSQEEIDQLLLAISTGEIPEEELDEYTRKIKIYDFRRPDSLTRREVFNLEYIHNKIADQMKCSISKLLGCDFYCHVASIDLFTYEEFIRSIPNPTDIAVFEMFPLDGHAAVEIDPSVLAEMLAYLKKRCFGQADQKKENIDQTFRDLIFNEIITRIDLVWRKIVNLTAEVTAVEANPVHIRIAENTDMVILVSIESRLGEIERMMNICIPYKTISPLKSDLSKLCADYPIRRIGSLKTKSFNNVSINTCLKIDCGNMTYRDLAILTDGDTVPFDFDNVYLSENNIFYNSVGCKIKDKKLIIKQKNRFIKVIFKKILTSIPKSRVKKIGYFIKQHFTTILVNFKRSIRNKRLKNIKKSFGLWR